MSELFAAAVSIAPTRRRRFLWAAWWTAPPSREPFRRPDASEGGARSRDEALRRAEKAAGRTLVQIEPLWARAWARVLMGEPPFTQTTGDATRAAPRASREPEQASIWQLLGLTPQATVAEIRAAFRQRALVTHPDRGGDPEAFRALRAAHDEALARRTRTAKRPRRKRPES
ncbi:DnaJ domain-containing protein [Nannocystis exedens]|uniref:DnaJ domain-containing protein n=1 Tax=Nannocystis exedens TaxID=54 RepID=A0A1I1UAJ3_9BACT|nr:DnaJ domain-containing protein [Nannocystis exedens]PCC71549.1 DnaJ domain protein [Nannocystis exedens]SFD67714.1 DnaJ domain-containing protein [Nannocystis exedens]